MRRTYQPSKKRRTKTHGFLTRMADEKSRDIFKRRRAKKRKRVSIV